MARIEKQTFTLRLYLTCWCCKTQSIVIQNNFTNQFYFFSLNYCFYYIIILVFMTTKKQNAILWASQITASVILLQVVVLKFLAVPEAVFLFNKLGLEPLGRIGSASLEFIAAICLLSSRLAVIGAFTALGVMLVAIYAHITKLGIVLIDNSLQLNDGGSLFALSLTVAVCSIITILFRKKVIDVASPSSVVTEQNLA